MAIKYINALRDAMLDEVTTALDAGATGGTLKIYAGSVPTTASGTATGATLLGTLTLSNPAAPAASAGVLTLSSITQDSSADTTGTAAFFRMTDTAGNVKVQGTVGTTGADLNLNTVSITTGSPISVSSFVLTEGNS